MEGAQVRGVENLEVDLDADWSSSASGMAGFVIVGVMRRGTRVEGVLAFNSEARTYVRVNGAAIEVLDEHDIAAVRSSLDRQQQLPQSA